MSENEFVSVGEKIKEVFKDAGLTQQDVAEILNLDQSTIAKLLSSSAFGKKSVKKWEKALGFRSNWLLTGEGDIFTSDHPKVYEYKRRKNSNLNNVRIRNVKGDVSGNISTSGGHIISIPNFGGKKIIKGDGEIELQNSVQSLETWEIERNSLNQRIADLENMVNMKDEIISTLKENISLLKKMTPST